MAANQGEADCRERWQYVAMSGDFCGRNRNLLTESLYSLYIALLCAQPVNVSIE